MSLLWSDLLSYLSIVDDSIAPFAKAVASFGGVSHNLWCEVWVFSNEVIKLLHHLVLLGKVILIERFQLLEELSAHHLLACLPLYSLVVKLILQKHVGHNHSIQDSSGRRLGTSQLCNIRLILLQAVS